MTVVCKNAIFILARSFESSNREFIIMISEVKQKSFLNGFKMVWVVNGVLFELDGIWSKKIEIKLLCLKKLCIEEVRKRIFPSINEFNIKIED